MVSDREPDVPVIVTGRFCCVTELSTEKVRTSEVVAELDAKEAVTPLGRVEVTARLTLPVKPPASVTLIVAVPVPPGFRSNVRCELDNQ